MKLSTVGAYSFSILMTAVLALTACGQKKDDGVSGTPGRSSVAGAPTAPLNPGGHIDQAFYLTGSSANYGSVADFGQNIRDFLAAQVLPDAIGDINDQSVILAGYIETTATGQINNAPSVLSIWIKDSYALTGGFDPFYVRMNAVSGTFNSSQVTATFRNAEHEVTLQGSVVGSQIVGTLGFRNLKDMAGGDLKSAQTMGYFTANTCALINCGRK